jgi:hypothetical protein
MPPKIERAISPSNPVPRSHMDEKTVFADKRVIPPFRQSEARIAGTLHLPGALSNTAHG